MFKDKANINHRNPQDYVKNLHLLADAVKSGQMETLREFLLEGSVETYSHNPDHTACTYTSDMSERITEKRLCRCIYFLSNDKVSDEQKQKCASCKFPLSKLKLGGGYDVEDYEVAAPYNEHNGIDLVWKGSDGAYAVEVKPANSTETILRMVAEILTYTLPVEGQAAVGKPAICFFQKNTQGKLSAQWREYLAWKGNEDFKTILKCVHIFYFTKDGDRLTIHDAEKEPICKL